MDRFYCEDIEKWNVGDIIRLDRAEENHLFKILRAIPGHVIGLMNGHGITGKGTVCENRMVQITEKTNHVFTGKRLHLYIAPPRRQKMDVVLKSITELGVYRIQPMLCDFSVAQPDGGSTERQTDLMLEACKQSGNPFLPILEMPMKFSDAVSDAMKKCSRVFYGSPYVDGQNKDDDVADIAFFVGPEGGFSAKEEQMMKGNNFMPIQIGNWILRVETAAVAGIAKLL